MTSHNYVLIRPNDMMGYNNFQLNIPSGTLQGSLFYAASPYYGEIAVDRADRTGMVLVSDSDETCVEWFNREVINNLPMAIVSFDLTFDANRIEHDDYIFLSQLFADPSLKKMEIGLGEELIGHTCHTPEQLFDIERLGEPCYFITLSYTYSAWDYIGPEKCVSGFGG